MSQALPIFSDKVRQIHIGEAAILHFLDIGPRGECLLAAGHDDDADACILFEGIQRLSQLADQGGIECVQSLGPVQGDEANGLLCLDGEVVEGHDGSHVLRSGGDCLRGSAV